MPTLYAFQLPHCLFCYWHVNTFKPIAILNAKQCRTYSHDIRVNTYTLDQLLFPFFLQNKNKGYMYFHTMQRTHIMHAGWLSATTYSD